MLTVQSSAPWVIALLEDVRESVCPDDCIVWDSVNVSY